MVPYRRLSTHRGGRPGLQCGPNLQAEITCHNCGGHKLPCNWSVQPESLPQPVPGQQRVTTPTLPGNRRLALAPAHVQEAVQFSQGVATYTV